MLRELRAKLGVGDMIAGLELRDEAINLLVIDIDGAHLVVDHLFADQIFQRVPLDLKASRTVVGGQLNARGGGVFFEILHGDGVAVDGGDDLIDDLLGPWRGRANGQQQSHYRCASNNATEIKHGLN